MKSSASRSKFLPLRCISGRPETLLPLLLLVFLSITTFCHAQETNRPRGTTTRGEIISPDAYDNGTYKGFITSAPGNKKNYSGFIYIPQIQ